MTTFTEMLAGAERANDSMLCVGLDPEPAKFPGATSDRCRPVLENEATLPHLYELALGGTAVGTGLNAHAQFAVRVADAYENQAVAKTVVK